MGSIARDRSVFGWKTWAILFGTMVVLSAVIAVYVLPEASATTKVMVILGGGLAYLASVLTAFFPQGRAFRSTVVIAVAVALATAFSYIWVHYGLPLVLSWF